MGSYVAESLRLARRHPSAVDARTTLVASRPAANHLPLIVPEGLMALTLSLVWLRHMLPKLQMVISNRLLS